MAKSRSARQCRHQFAQQQCWGLLLKGCENFVRQGTTANRHSPWKAGSERDGLVAEHERGLLVLQLQAQLFDLL